MRSSAPVSPVILNFCILIAKGTVVKIIIIKALSQLFFFCAKVT